MHTLAQERGSPAPTSSPDHTVTSPATAHVRARVVEADVVEALRLHATVEELGRTARRRLAARRLDDRARVGHHRRLRTGRGPTEPARQEARRVLVDAMLCDHVQPGGDGKLYLSGAGASVFVTAARAAPFPIRVGVAVTIEMTADEAPGAHPIAVSVRGAGGLRVPQRVAGRDGVVDAVTGSLQIGAPPPGAHDAVLLESFCSLLDLEVPAAGTYAVVVEIDGAERRALPFRAGLGPAPDQIPEPAPHAD